MTKKTLVLLAVCLSLLLFGCKEEAEIQRANLLINATVGDAALGKTIAPPRDEMNIISYTLKGKGPDGSLLDSLASSTGRFEVKNLLCGQWRFEAMALNSKGNAIAKGRKTEIVGPETKSATIQMDELPGIGRLELDFMIDGDISLDNGAQARLVIEIYHRETNTRASYERPIDGRMMRSLLVIEALHAGSYQVSATLYRNDDIMSSAVEVVRMLDKTLTKGQIILEVDEESAITDVDVVTNVSAPVAGTIKVRRMSRPDEEPFYVLTFAPASGISAETLNYKWFEGGNQMPNCDMRSCEARPARRTKYTLVVHSTKHGSDASYSVALDPIPKEGAQNEEPKSLPAHRLP